MRNIRKPNQRKSESCLSDEEIAKIYKCILVSVENEKPKLKGYKVDGPEMKKIQEELGFGFGKRNEIETDADAKDDTFYLKKYKRHSTVPSLFLHLRDAFAHNRIFKNESGNVMFEDCKNGNITMYARISSIDKLIDIVDAIKKTRRTKTK